MSKEQKRILDLTRLLGLALGALEVIRLTPYDFNQDGVAFVIDQLKRGLEKSESDS